MARIVLVALSFLFMTQAYSQGMPIDIRNGRALETMRKNIEDAVEPIRKCTDPKKNRTAKVAQDAKTKADALYNAIARAEEGCSGKAVGTDVCTKLILAAVPPLNALFAAQKFLNSGTYPECQLITYNDYPLLWKAPPQVGTQASPAPATKPAAPTPPPKPTAQKPAPAPQPSSSPVSGRTNAQKLQRLNNLVEIIKKKNGKYASPEIAKKADLLVRAQEAVNTKCSAPEAQVCTTFLNATEKAIANYIDLTTGTTPQLKVVTPKK